MAKKKTKRRAKAETQAAVDIAAVVSQWAWANPTAATLGKMPLWRMVDLAGDQAKREGLTKVVALAASSLQLLERELVYLTWMRQQTEAHLSLVRALDRSIDGIILDIEQKATVSTTKISSEGAHDAGSNQGS